MALAYLNTVRLFNRDTRLYLLMNALFGFSFWGIYAVLFNLYVLRLGYGTEFVGLVNAVALVTFGGFALPAGALGRRFGSRNLMIVGLVGTMVGLGLAALAEFVPGSWQSPWLLVMSLAAYGFGACYATNLNPFLMGITTSRERTHAFTAQMAVTPLAAFGGNLAGGLLPGAFAALFGGSLAQPMPYRYALLVGAALAGAGSLFAWMTREPTRMTAGGRAGEPAEAPLGTIVLLAGTWLLVQAGNGAAFTFFNVYLDDGLHAPTALIGTLSATAQLLAAPIVMATPLIAARLGHARTAAYSGALLGAMLLPWVLVPHWSAVGGGMIAMTALRFMGMASYSVYTMEATPPSWRTMMAGATNLSVGVGWAAMALGGGYAIRAFGYQTFFFMAAALTLSGSAAFWALFVRSNRLSAAGGAD